MSNKLTGRAFITINGQRVESLPGATYTMGGVEREGVAAESGVAGYREKVVVPTVEFTIPHKKGVSARQIHAITDGTLVFETDTGVAEVLEHCWSASTPTLSSNGDLRCKFQAMRDREE